MEVVRGVDSLLSRLVGIAEVKLDLNLLSKQLESVKRHVGELIGHDAGASSVGEEMSGRSGTECGEVTGPAASFRLRKCSPMRQRIKSSNIVEVGLRTISSWCELRS